MSHSTPSTDTRFSLSLETHTHTHTGQEKHEYSDFFFGEFHCQYTKEASCTPYHPRARHLPPPLILNIHRASRTCSRGRSILFPGATRRFS